VIHQPLAEHLVAIQVHVVDLQVLDRARGVVHDDGLEDAADVLDREVLEVVQVEALERSQCVDDDDELGSQKDLVRVHPANPVYLDTFLGEERFAFFSYLLREM